MDDILVVIGPITSALRLCKKLESTTHFKCRVVHTPSQLSRGGCSYSIKTTSGAMPYLINIANRYKSQIKKIYVINRINGESVYNVVSG